MFFIKTSGKIKPNWVARLQSPVYSGNAKTSGNCFQFWYHMYGSSIGKLNLYIKKTGQALGSARWSRSTNQGNKWSIGQLSISSQSSYKVLTFLSL